MDGQGANATSPTINPKEFFRKLAKEIRIPPSNLSRSNSIEDFESTDNPNTHRENLIHKELENIRIAFQNLVIAMNGNELKSAVSCLKVIQKVGWNDNTATFSIDMRRAIHDIIKEASIDEVDTQQIELEEKTDAWQVDFECLKLGKKIAEGFFGEVYKGSMYGKKVAVKRLKFSENVEKDKIIRKLKEEAAIMSSIRHPNVLLFMGLSSTLPNICLVTEFMENGSLDEVLQKTVVDDKTFFRMLKDICYGMNYLHNRSVLHLDLKPLNLLVDHNLTIKVADFGISRVAQNFDIGIKGHQGYGTILYMPPEAIMGGNDDNALYDYTFDVFSFGVMLFELMLMRDQKNINFSKHDSIGYDLIREPLMFKKDPKIAPWWHKSLANLVMRCTSNDPKARPRFEVILKELEPIEVENEWFILRHSAKTIRDLAANRENHPLLLEHKVWDTLAYIIERYNDHTSSFYALCAMIDLAETKPNIPETLNQVIERLQHLLFDVTTGIIHESFMEILRNIGEFVYFQKLLDSPYLMSMAKENVLKVLLAVASDETIVDRFMKQGMIKFLFRQICRNSSKYILLYNLHHITCLLLKRITSYESKKMLNRFVSHGGLDLLIYFATNGTKNLVFLSLQTLAEMSIKDSSIAVKIEQKGIKPTQMASRAYLGALLSKIDLNADSSVQHLQPLKEKTMSANDLYQRSSHSFHLARDKLSNILDPIEQKYSISVDEGEVLVKLWELLKEQSDLDHLDTSAIRKKLQSEFAAQLIEQQYALEAQIEKVVGQIEPATKVLDFLYLGSEWNSSNLSELKRDGVTDILNLSGESPNYYPTQFQYHNVRIDRNDPDFSFDTYLAQIYQIFEKARLNNKIVLVHSYLGVGRSVAFVIAYLMKHEKWPLSKAFKHVKDRRPFIQVSRQLMRGLMDLEIALGFEGSLGLSSLQVVSPRNRTNNPMETNLTPRTLAKQMKTSHANSFQNIRRLSA
jgi:serine/threonine protein kinase